jgi:hypothetical protein
VLCPDQNSTKKVNAFPNVKIFRNCSPKGLFHLYYTLRLKFQHFGIATDGYYASVYRMQIEALVKVLPKWLPKFSQLM